MKIPLLVKTVLYASFLLTIHFKVLSLPSGYAILQAYTQPANVKDNPFPVPLTFRKIGDVMI
jgi:hypothetical protein